MRKGLGFYGDGMGWDLALGMPLIQTSVLLLLPPARMEHHRGFGHRPQGHPAGDQQGRQGGNSGLGIEGLPLWNQRLNSTWIKFPMNSPFPAHLPGGIPGYQIHPVLRSGGRPGSAAAGAQQDPPGEELGENSWECWVGCGIPVDQAGFSGSSISSPGQGEMVP